MTIENYNYLENQLKLNSYTNGEVILINSISNFENNQTDILIKIACESQSDFNGALFSRIEKINELEVYQNLFYNDPVFDTIHESSGNKNNISFLFLFLSFIINLKIDLY